MYENQQYGGDRPMKSNGNGRLAQEEASFRKAAADTQFFWNQVTRNNGALRKTQRVLNPQHKAREESQLFGNHTDVLQGVIQDSIPVERSGPGADAIPVLEKFSDLHSLPSFIMMNIRLMKYESPSPIQKHSVPLGLAGLDLMCCAQTGSGKTFAFLLPVIASIFTFEETAGQEPSPSPTPGVNAETGGGIRSPSQLQGQIDERGCMPKAIILAPTRELACQIHTESKKLCHNSDMKTVVVYGGSDIRAQLAELSTGCDMIVATPGRLNDLVDRGVVSFCKVIFLVLDEADRMLDMGFEPQIRRIVQENDMPSKDTRQTFLFSATFPDEIQSLAREFLRDYVWIGVGRVGSTVENIEQRLLEASSDPNQKMNMLLAAINEIEGRTLVFVQKKRTAAWVCQCLQQFGVASEEIHGDRTQMQREHALRQFREGRTRVLVATDVAARGLDVPAVTHVIQFDMPISSEDFDTYVHRIGRTGRAGKSGVATSFYVPGRETGEGNGKIAQLIMRLLQENNQAVPDWFMNIDDHRYGGGGAVRRAPFNKNQQGRPTTFGGRDVRGFQSQQGQGQGQGGYGSGSGTGGYNGYNQGQNQQSPRMVPQGQNQNQGQNQGQGQGQGGYGSGSGTGGYNGYNQGQNQQSPRMVPQGQNQNQGQNQGQGQGPRQFIKYGQQGQGQGQGQGYSNQNQGQGQYQGQNNYQQQGNDNHQQQQQQQSPYMRQQQQQPQPPRYGSQGSQVDSNQYGQQTPYGTMAATQNITPVAGGIVPQGAYYDNYGMMYSPPGEGVPAGGNIDTVTAQMGHMTVTQGQGQGQGQVQNQGQGQVQVQQRAQHYVPDRSVDATVSYAPVPSVGVVEGNRMPMPVVQGQGGSYTAQGYMASPPMVPVPQYEQNVYPGAPAVQGTHGNVMYGQNQGQGQGQDQQNQGYGGRGGGGGGYNAGGRGGRGMGGGGRALNVDARPFNVPNVYQGGQGQVQGQVQTQGRDYNNHGQGPGRGHMQYDPQHQGGGMGNQNGYNNIGNYGYAQQQQQQPFVPYSASNGNPAGSNIYNQSGRTESYPPAQSVGGSGGGVGQVAVDSHNGGESNSNSNSSQQKNSDPSASS